MAASTRYSVVCALYCLSEWGWNSTKLCMGQILQVGVRIPFQWVVISAIISEYLYDKKDSKKIE